MSELLILELQKVLDGGETLGETHKLIIDQLLRKEGLKIGNATTYAKPPKMDIPLQCETPVNPFTGVCYKENEFIAGDFETSETLGQYATRKQWQSIGRKCLGNPTYKRRLYGNNIEFFSYEQTEQI